MLAPEPVMPEIFALVMPITLPSMSNSGPPELPALMAASVWNMLMGLPLMLISRGSALT